MSLEVKNAVDKLGNTFAEFRAENDRRLKEIENKGRADPLIEEKVNKLSASVGEYQAAVDDLIKKAQRPGGTVEDASAELHNSHRRAFHAWARSGEVGELPKFQAEIATDNDAKGGYLVPKTLDSEIEKHERDNTPMRQVCRVINVSNEGYQKLVKSGDAGSGWVGEREARPETDAPTWALLEPYFGEIYAKPKVTQRALDDASINLEAELGEDIGIEFAEQENAAYTVGNGVKKPKGFLSYDLSTDADGTRAFGSIQKIVTGSSGNFVADKILDLVGALKAPYRNGAVFMGSGLAMTEIRKLKDGEGNYLWRASFEAGAPSTLLGYPTVENEDMAAPEADANALAFGNFRRAYYVLDVQGSRMLRDPYTDKPFVVFYTTKRVGGFLVQDRAIKVLTLSN